MAWPMPCAFWLEQSTFSRVAWPMSTRRNQLPRRGAQHEPSARQIAFAFAVSLPGSVGLYAGHLDLAAGVGRAERDRRCTTAGSSRSRSKSQIATVSTGGTCEADRRDG